MENITLPLVGFLIGLLIISLGGGGGGIYVGILTAFFNVPPAIAAATSLATIIPTTTIGTVSHWRAGNVNARLGLTMMGGAVVGAIVGSSCSDLLPQSLYTKLTGILLLILGMQMIMVYRKKKQKKSGQETTPSLKERRLYCLANSRNLCLCAGRYFCYRFSYASKIRQC